MAASCRASGSSRFIVVVTEGVTADTLSDPAFPKLTALARSGRVALMNTAVAGRRTTTAADLTLALGTREPSDLADEQVFGAGEPAEGTTADVVYRRRTGETPAARPGAASGGQMLLNLGIASLVRRGLANRTVGAAAAGRVLFASDVPAGAPGRSAALLTLDGAGTGAGLLAAPGPGAAAELAAWASARPESVVVRLRDPAELEPFLAAVQPAQARLLVLSACPALARDGRWHRLTLAVLAGPGVGRGLLTSATTRTPGLVANVDVAPTLLGWLGVPTPASIVGHPFANASADGGPRAVTRLDDAVRTNALVEDPLYIVLGVVATLVALGGLAALLFRPRAAGVFAFVLLCLMNMPLAMLLAAGLCFQPGHLAAGHPAGAQAAIYISAMAAFMLLGGVLAAALRRWMTPPATVGIVTCSALVLDVLCGQPMVKLSLLSSYQLSGIRFYGVGNEYAGIVVGFALLAAFLARSRPAVSGVLFLLLALVLGSPRLGANAGMLIAAAVGFVSGWWALKGRRAIWPAALAGALVGVAAALALAALDRAFGGSAPSHMGGALQAAGAEGWRYLARIAVRKELMNLRIIVHPGMLAAVGAVALVVLLSRRLMGPRLACFMDRHPGYCRSLGPAGWGALAALLFNDSGVVAAIFVVGVLVAAGVWLLLTDPPVPQKAAA